MSKAWNLQRHNHRAPVPDGPVPPGVDYDMWLGPAPKRPFNPNRFHSYWQWYRDYGNGDIGNDGSHDLDMAHFGLSPKGLPIRITAHGSRIDLKGVREYPDNMMVAFQYPDDKVLLYEDRGWTPYGGYGFDSGNAFYGTEGFMIFSRRGYFQVYLGKKEEKESGHAGRYRQGRALRQFPGLRAFAQAAQRSHRTGPPLLRPQPPGRGRLPDPAGASLRSEDRNHSQ